VYVAGRDADGSSNGTVSSTIFSFYLKDDFLFVGNWSFPIACSQTAGFAQGCELQVYNISNPENPVYVAGRDSDGSNGGNTSSYIFSLTSKGDYLFVGKDGNFTSCSQTPGLAQGCEIQVYDISDPANPIYVAGRDSDGSNDGETSIRISSITIKDNYLFLGSWPYTIACSQTPGLAQGCEIKVYDISSSTNPVYIAGRDVDGSEDGVNSGTVNSLFIKDNHLFVGKDSGSYPCDPSLPAGSVVNCELQVYDISSSTNPIYVKGMDISGHANGTGSGSISSLIFKNHHLFVGKQGNATACSQVAGSALGCELQVYSFATFLNHTTSFTISQEINTEISLTPISPIVLGSIPGLTGGQTADGYSELFTIKTNNPTGYFATIHFSDEVAMQRVDGGGFINNYAPVDLATPDYNFIVPDKSHGFGYMVNGGNDTAQKFMIGGGDCGLGVGWSNYLCWYNQPDATIPVKILERQTPTSGSGNLAFIRFKIGVAPNPSPALPEGMYQATATITVLPN